MRYGGEARTPLARAWALIFLGPLGFKLTQSDNQCNGSCRTRPYPQGSKDRQTILVIAGTRTVGPIAATVTNCQTHTTMDDLPLYTSSQWEDLMADSPTPPPLTRAGTPTGEPQQPKAVPTLSKVVELLVFDVLNI